MRIRKIVSGTPEQPRMTVYRSNKQIYVQFIDDLAGVTLATASSLDKEVAEAAAGKNKCDVAALVGKLAAERAAAKGISTVAFDRNGYLYHGRVKQLAEADVYKRQIELYPGQGAAMARSAGSYAQLLAREGKFAIIKLPSGETRMVLVTCRATVGVVSNVDHSLESSGKAGRERWLGRRPRNRGVVMNPVDHPMGGGEGRASGGHPRSRKGLLAKGYKTRNPKKTTSKFIISKKKK